MTNTHQTSENNTLEHTKQTTPPIWFWIVSGIALLWYLMDTSAFFMRLFASEEGMQTMSAIEQQLLENIPLWVNIVFAFEVFGGTLGAIALLLKKKWALCLFYISLAGVLAQTTYLWFLSNHVEVMGAPAIVMPSVAILIGIGLIILSKSSLAKKWLH